MQVGGCAGMYSCGPDGLNSRHTALHGYSTHKEPLHAFQGVAEVAT